MFFIWSIQGTSLADVFIHTRMRCNAKFQVMRHRKCASMSHLKIFVHDFWFCSPLLSDLIFHLSANKGEQFFLPVCHTYPKQLPPNRSPFTACIKLRHGCIPKCSLFQQAVIHIVKPIVLLILPWLIATRIVMYGNMRPCLQCRDAESFAQQHLQKKLPDRRDNVPAQRKRRPIPMKDKI